MCVFVVGVCVYLWSVCVCVCGRCVCVFLVVCLLVVSNASMIDLLLYVITVGKIEIWNQWFCSGPVADPGLATAGHPRMA